MLNSGQLRREIYTNVFGLGVADLTNSSKFPSSPDIMTTVNFFETPSQFGEQYGQRISGYLLPPVTGNYTFYLAADDQAVLYLSPTTNSADKIPIAHEWYWAFP